MNFNPLPLLRVSSFPRKRPKHRIKAESLHMVENTFKIGLFLHWGNLEHPSILDKVASYPNFKMGTKWFWSRIWTFNHFTFKIREISHEIAGGWNDILFLKLFRTNVRKNCSSDWEKLLQIHSLQPRICKLFEITETITWTM